MINKRHKDLKKTGHFIPLEMMPEVDGGEKFNEVLDMLETMKTSGFVLTIDNKPKYYVKGVVLASRLDDLYSGEVTSLNQRVIELITDVPDAFMRIMQVPPATESVEELQRREDTVFEVDGGWLLNHEGVVETRTQTVGYYCTNKVDPGAPHKTFNANLRNCRICSYRINR